MLFNYLIGTNLNKDCVNHKFSKKSILTFGIMSNLALLVYFKYMDFFIENINVASGSEFDLLYLALPLAISFFTFQQIAYLVDSYKQETKEYDFLNYALFVTFFPQLIAGPIVHHSEMMPQFAKTKNKVKNYKNITMGVFIFSVGLFKKVVIADYFSGISDLGFNSLETLNLFSAWITSLSYTLQLYFDFSGYTDMAIGIALLFNIKIPINFNSPYKALDIQDFWRRWHLTLSRFLKDYIYIPLGGNRESEFKTYTNLFMTFIIGGLWHGAGWTFIFWGAMHGSALVGHRLWRSLGFSMPSWLGWFITFNFINVTWVFFRANSWENAVRVINGMFSFDNIVLPEFLMNQLNFVSVYGLSFSKTWLTDISANNYTLVYMVLSLGLVFIFENSNQMTNKLSKNKKSYYYHILSGCLLFCALKTMMVVTDSAFLYFNF